MREHERWLEIVKEDLAVAKFLLKGEFFSTVAYHSQQAAEKALKAFLVFKDRPVLKSHDLLKLLRLCSLVDNDFQKLFDAADYVNPFSTKFRYPDEFNIPDLQAAQLAIKHAQSIVTFVNKKIAASGAESQQGIFED
jgi:HEPN domain-containing protein